MKSIDFGHQGLNDHANTPDIFDTAKFPTATYSGKLAGFSNGAPKTVEGNLTMHGVTKPVTLTINSFKCAPDRSGREKCGADASATINREDFGVAFGKNFGFDMKVRAADSGRGVGGELTPPLRSLETTRPSARALGLLVRSDDN